MNETKGNAFFGTGSSSKINPAKAPLLQKRMRYKITKINQHGGELLLTIFENRAAADRSFIAATESNLPAYRYCTFEMSRVDDDVVIRTAKHKSLLKQP